MATTPDLVIFDCDGVIVDSEPISAAVIAANLTRYGWPMSAADCDALFRGGTIYLIRDAAQTRGLALPAGWIDDVYAEMFAALAETRPIEGAVAVLDALEARGAAYCLASNGPQEKMAATLRATGLTARFEGRRFSAREVARAKPAPDLFLHAAERMGASPAGSVVIGDSENDANAARAAGIRCYGLTGHVSADRFEELGAIPFAGMSFLPALLGFG